MRYSFPVVDKTQNWRRNPLSFATFHLYVIYHDKDIGAEMLMNPEDFVKVKNRAMVYRGPNSFSGLLYKKKNDSVTFHDIRILPFEGVKSGTLHTSVYHRIKLKKSIFDRIDLK